MKLSVIIPVYNESKTIKVIIDKVLHLPLDKEIIVVDDGSTDGTRDILRKIEDDSVSNDLRLIYHEYNQGKGAAVKTALEHAHGEYSIIQDGDLEYDPNDHIKLLDKAQLSNADIIYGSRFIVTWRSTSLCHYFVNWFLTTVTNIFYGSRLTDMETCYKMIRTDVFRGLKLESQGFEIEPEITAKLLRQGYKIAEVPISYRMRSYHEGKKITWYDGLIAIWTLIALRFVKIKEV